jgi:hypothetical protein
MDIFKNVQKKKLTLLYFYILFYVFVVKLFNSYEYNFIYIVYRMASTSGTGSTETDFKAGSVLPNEVVTAGGFKPSDYASKGGRKSRQQQEGGALAFSELKGGALAFSELKGGKKKRSRKTSRKTSRKSSKKTSNKRGKKTLKTMIKGLFGIFKK